MGQAMKGWMAKQFESSHLLCFRRGKSSTNTDAITFTIKVKLETIVSAKQTLMYLGLDDKRFFFIRTASCCAAKLGERCECVSQSMAWAGHQDFSVLNVRINENNDEWYYAFQRELNDWWVVYSAYFLNYSFNTQAHTSLTLTHSISAHNTSSFIRFRSFSS